ncbi:MAG: chorismate-binding protein [Flavobacteriales bacterium]|nr:chorismate-binding protein [Flavobacteriales bacterium]
MDSREKLIQLERSNLPFCAFSLPDSNEINIILQADEDFESEKSAGMVMAPFEESADCPIIYIRPDYLGSIEDLNLSLFDYLHFEDSGYLVDGLQPAWREGYIDTCEQLIERLKAGQAEKVVLSVLDPRPYNAVYTDLFISSVKDYTKAFVYFLHAPGTFTGIGASPEVLLERSGDQCRTMSLAGTKKTGGQPWAEKEKEEQEIVTRYILNRLAEEGVEDIQYSDPYDEEAGPLVHLRSDILFRTLKKDNDILSALHPTPAVCGQPLEAARSLIHELEEHERRYYTGYIGIAGAQSSRYFVNLRCMEKKDYYALCYAGGGVTASSDAVSEWQEVINKLEVMGRFIPTYND